MPHPGSDLPPIITTPGTPTMTATGFFVAGTEALFYFNFTDINGNLFDPSDMSILIFKSEEPSVILVNDTLLDKLDLGTFGYAWKIPKTAKAGRYTVTIVYTSETIDGPVENSFSEDFVIVEHGQLSVEPFTLRQVASRGYLETLLGYTQRIKIFDEIARFNKAKTTAELSFPRWNQTAGIRLSLNGQPKETGFSVDYLKGRIYFTKPLSTYDEVRVTYNFRWFTDEELDNLIEQGVNIINIWPITSAYTINNMPDYWVIGAIYAAAVDALRRWLMDINFQEPAKIFGGLDRAKDVFGNFDSLKKNYEEFLLKMLDQKKRGPYLGQTKTITVPEFTLPGGRCFADDTLISAEINGKIVECTIADLYESYENGDMIKVLSRDTNSDEYRPTCIYSPASKIWKSGVKDVYTLTTNWGKKIRATKEHLFYVNGHWWPLSIIRAGDHLLSADYDRKRIYRDEVKSIVYSGECETYDIEVPGTENLFANGINCHNSRWFRYLFKGA